MFHIIHDSYPFGALQLDRTDVLDIISPYAFLDKCRETRKKDETGRKRDTKTYYDLNKVKKIVHLLRNPLDNVVSRFHLQYKYKVKEGDDEWVSEML